MVGKWRAMTTALLLTRRGSVSSCASSIRKLPAQRSDRVLSSGVVMGLLIFYESWTQACSEGVLYGRFLEWGDDLGGLRSLQARQIRRRRAKSVLLRRRYLRGQEAHSTGGGVADFHWPGVQTCLGRWRLRSCSQLRWSAARNRATRAEGIDPSWRMRPQPLINTRRA